MYYYAYINADNIVTGVYELPTPVTIDGYIEITQDQYENGDLVGKVYDPVTGTFSTLPDWIGSTDEVKYKSTNVTLSDKLDSIENTIAGKANTSDLHSHENKDVLDGITASKVTAWDNATQGADGATFTPTVSSEGVISWTNDKGLTNPTPVNIKGADGADGSNGLSAYELAVQQGFTGTLTEWLTSLQGEDGTDGTDGVNGTNGTTVVVGTTTTGDAGTNASVTGTLDSSTNTLTLNFTVPRGATGESGSSASITADEVLTKIKTVDGADSGLDADTLDGVQASGFALASHSHDEYATTSSVNTALESKADASHTHSNYATVDDVSALQTAVNGKASVEHTHSNYATTSEVTELSTAVNGKANIIHTHSGYASTSDIETLQTAIDGKAATNHTHSEYANANHTHSDATAEASGFLSYSDKSKLDGIATGANNYVHPASHPASMVEGLATVATSGSYNDLTNKPSAMTPTAHTHAQYDVTGLATALNGKASASHTHSQSDITGLETALSGKANTSHTHSIDDVTETTSKKIMTSAERTKLSGIAENANNYTHPASHPASMITGLSSVATSGSYEDLSNKPTIPTIPASLPANGGNADTVDNKHASDFATASHTHSQYATLSDVYPVGSVYLSVNNVNPSTLFGGTWTSFGAGRVLMGVPSGGSAEATGGSETASISAHTHTTAGHVLTLNEIPEHNHALLNYNVDGNTSYTFTKSSVESNIKKGFDGNVMTTYKGGGQSHSHGDTGLAGGTTINVVQPYITCYMWKRTN